MMKDILLNHLQKMMENEFTNRVFIPLMEKLGYDDVQFHGGTYEEGKDFIAAKKTPFDDYEITVGQVKKFKGGRGRNVSQQYGDIIHQLRMAIEKKIPYKDNRLHAPKNVIFVTPFVVDTRLLNEQFEKQISHTIQIRTVDGAILKGLIRKHLPDLETQILGIAHQLEQQDTLHLSNRELHSALNIEGTFDYKKYYSDLSFFVGTVDSNYLLNCAIEVKDKVESIPEATWPQMFEALEALQTCIGFDPSEEGITAIIESYKKMSAKFNSPPNLKRISDRNEGMELLKIQLSRINDNITKDKKPLLKELDDEKANKDPVRKLQIEESLFKLDSLGGIYSSVSDEIYSGGLEAKLAAAEKSLENLKFVSKQKLIGDAHIIGEQVRTIISLTREILPSPKYSVRLNSEAIKQYLANEILWYQGKVKDFNQGAGGSSDLRAFLKKVERLLYVVNTIKNAHPQLTGFFSFSHESGNRLEDRFTISPHSVIDSGENVAIYGEAGAGKTTTLQMYAKSFYDSPVKDHSVIYIPVNRILANSSPLLDESKDPETSYKTLFHLFLKYRNTLCDSDGIAEFERYLSKKSRVILILDGLDEAASRTPWVFHALNSLMDIKKNFQIVVSSRDCVKYLDRINFLGITLLPFSREQIDFFVRGWIGNEIISEKLIQQLGEKGLYDVVKNPLLATIVCSLAINDFDTPENEVEIYRKRFELLCSTYDEHKNVRRIETPQNILMRCCRSIAFHLHSQNLREASASDMVAAVFAATFQKYTKNVVEKAVSELISPCNILLNVPGTDFYTFGHLRFQEFLVAEELTVNRSIDMLGYFTSDWWRGALYLYAFDNDVSHFFDSLYKHFSEITSSSDTLRKMIEARPKATRKRLFDLLGRYLDQDRKDAYMYLDYEDIDYDASEIGLGHFEGRLNF